MRKAILFVVALVFSIATCSQTGGRAREAFEIKHSVFFADGSLDEYMTSEWNSVYTRVDNEVRFSASGTMLEQVEYAYNEDKGWKTTKITRDVESRLKNRVVYQYNPQGQLWRENLVDNKGKVVSTFEYAYDGKGNQISRIMKNRTGNKLAETVFAYDASGKMTTSETKDAADKKISATRYTYDGQGNLINQQVTNADGRVTSVTSSVWQGGHEMRIETASPDGGIQMRITNEYGRDGELTKKTIENFQGDSKQFIQYEYYYRAARRQS
jgi:YD repeat-containing protein